MNINKLDQFCNNFSYNEYTKLANYTVFGSLGTCLVNELFLNGSNSVDGLLLSSLIAAAGLTFTNGQNKTKDITEIKNLYQEFITNYNKLNKVFDFNEPVSIYTMFNYLIYKGYLSKDKQFEFNKDGVKDIKAIMGANVFTGKSVCRHISSMLNDILNDYGIEASPLYCYLDEYFVDVKVLDNSKYSKKELQEWVMNNIDNQSRRKIYNFIIDEYCEAQIPIEFNKEYEEDTLSKRKMGNHQISLASYNGKSYFLDPTNFKIYRLGSEKGILYSNENDKVEIKTIGHLLFGINEYLKIKNKLKQLKPSISINDEEQLVIKTLDVCENNIDIFEQFYNNNSEIYDEVNDKILKLKPGIFTR